ncbi:transposase domain-containing protein [Yersinia enterocolitica]|uniref:transposase domain-containing protein n=1 Tax=Yersinia enterocolitica TaxID=630 RepID=UPI0005E91C1C|nr:transposase domain-containing protein [Yersinia enterocolitica]EKN3387483.1 Mu transposase C-terminal domain-containing protein [Yersinia enterocolitica]EKN3392325.1 Mu transposase C-terminal domain-containing protein [Yersinia enterocolitica]EKN3571185.1 Mu transposase C-terminal domain-containing protein [Yersinia enterocolitica]EKN3586423.1 Mu transposase C-terminal domain-containing protein [Yersinia enterocolitica]EKN3769250.1 Mu transposase C-terminal domain-containing protein [Yersin
MDIWLTAQECVGLPNMPTAPFNISNRLKKNATESQMRKRQGSKAIEYHINCLSPVARSMVLKARGAIEINNKPFFLPKSEPINNYCRELLWRDWDIATEKQRNAAQKKTEAVQAVATLTDTGIDVVTAFDAVAETHGASVASVRRWYYTARKFAREDWMAALIGQYGKSIEARKKKEADCDQEAWDFFLADFLRPERPAFRTAFARLEEVALSHGWMIPSMSSMRRKMEREIPVEQRVLLREGQHAVMRLYPAQERTVADLSAMEWVNGDGYQHNVFVRWHNGEILRPKTWIWQDIRTRKILAWRTDVSENSDSIRLSLSDLIENYGIPQQLTIDNTRAAANKWLTGGVPNRYRFKVKEDDPMGIIPLLGIKLHWTSVLFGRGHGQAKPVERAFSHGGLGETVDKHPLLSGAHTGDNPMDKPDNYGSRAVEADVFLKVLAEGIAFWNRRTKRQTEICRGVMSFDQAFEESYQQSQVRKATAEQRRLLLLPAEAVRISESGTFVMEAGGKINQRRNRYYSERLIGLKPNKVIIRFDPQNLHNSVLCYTLDGRFIGEAQCIENVGFGDTQAAREHKRNRTQFIKRTKEAAAAQKRMSTLEAAELMPETVPPAPPESRVVEILRPNGNTMRRQLVEEDIDADESEEAFGNAITQLYSAFQNKQI